MSRRVLIVNADDFGRSPGVNQGVIRAHEQGIVTSATLMVRWPAAAEAAAYARRSSLSVGLHLDLGEWEYRDGEWHERYQVLPETPDASGTGAQPSARAARAVDREARPPTWTPTSTSTATSRRAPPCSQAGERLGIPVRWFTPGIGYSGALLRAGRQGHPATRRDHRRIPRGGDRGASRPVLPSSPATRPPSTTTIRLTATSESGKSRRCATLGSRPRSTTARSICAPSRT